MELPIDRQFEQDRRIPQGRVDLVQHERGEVLVVRRNHGGEFADIVRQSGIAAQGRQVAGIDGQRFQQVGSCLGFLARINAGQREVVMIGKVARIERQQLAVSQQRAIIAPELLIGLSQRSQQALPLCITSVFDVPRRKFEIQPLEVDRRAVQPSGCNQRFCFGQLA